jgi:hypothetical protein
MSIWNSAGGSSSGGAYTNNGNSFSLYNAYNGILCNHIPENGGIYYDDNGRYYYGYGSYDYGYNTPLGSETWRVVGTSEIHPGQPDFNRYAEINTEAWLPPMEKPEPEQVEHKLTDQVLDSWWWAGTKAFLWSIGETLYDMGNHLSFGLIDSERYNEQIEASGERLYNVASNLGYSNASIASGWGLSQAVVSDTIGAVSLSNGITGYDLGSNQLLDGYERVQQAVQGTAQFAGTLAGGLATGQAVSNGLKEMQRNAAIRRWYNDNVTALPENTTLSLREQAIKNFLERNRIKREARDMMSVRAAARLDASRPILPFSHYVRKAYQEKGLVGDDLWKYLREPLKILYFYSICSLGTRRHSTTTML